VGYSLPLMSTRSTRWKKRWGRPSSAIRGGGGQERLH
jgi:hypothetical protein